LTHDLLAETIATLGWRVRAVIITHLAEGTFYAEITLDDGAGGVRRLDARPSDSIALALRAGAPILVAQDVLEEAGGYADETDAEGAADVDGAAHTEDALGADAETDGASLADDVPGPDASREPVAPALTGR